MAAKGCNDPATMGTQAFEDTECAQALLDLAMSFTPTAKPPDVPRRQVVKRSSVKPHSPGKRKRLDSHYSYSAPQDFDPNCVLNLEGSSSSQLFYQLVGGICLDHSYALPGEIKDIRDQRRGSIDENHTRPIAAGTVIEKQELFQDGAKSKDELYKSDDAKYKNFNLLLKCLTNVEDSYVDPSKSSKKNNSRKKVSADSPPKADNNANDISGSSEEGLKLDSKGDSPIFSCGECSKTFSKKRYLMKHVHRMHSQSFTSEKMPTDVIQCPNCDSQLLQSDLPHHNLTCNHQLNADLANCQFCGLRMRRHILVKHLAQEHCIESDLHNDSDSATLSGSEHDLSAVNDAKAVCGICHVVIRVSILHQHILSSHVATLPSPVCSVCKLSFPHHMELVKHIVELHSVTPRSSSKTQQYDIGNGGGTVKHNMRSGSCKHSMLQRFLRDSSGSGNGSDQIEGGEQCVACVGSLVTSMAASSFSASPPMPSSHTSHAVQCSLSKDSNLLERTATELIEAALQF